MSNQIEDALARNNVWINTSLLFLATTMGLSPTFYPLRCVGINIPFHVAGLIVLLIIMALLLGMTSEDAKSRYDAIQDAMFLGFGLVYGILLKSRLNEESCIFLIGGLIFIGSVILIVKFFYPVLKHFQSHIIEGFTIMLNKAKGFLMRSEVSWFLLAMIFGLSSHWMMISAVVLILGVLILTRKTTELSSDQVKFLIILASGIGFGLAFDAVLSDPRSLLLRWSAIISVVAIAVNRYIVPVAKRKNWFDWMKALP